MWPRRKVNVDVTMAAMAMVVIGVFLDLHKWRSERWRPRAGNLERGRILTLKGSNRRLGRHPGRIQWDNDDEEEKRGHSDHSPKCVCLWGAQEGWNIQWEGSLQQIGHHYEERKVNVCELPMKRRNGQSTHKMMVILTLKWRKRHDQTWRPPPV